MQIDADKLVNSVIGQSMITNPQRVNYVDKLLDYRFRIKFLNESKRYPKGHYDYEIESIDEILKAFTQ